MTEMMLNQMAINADDLNAVNGGATIKCNIKKHTTGLATLRVKGSQSATRVAKLPAGTLVLGSTRTVKDRSSVYTYRFCYVPSLKKTGWIADSLLR